MKAERRNTRRDVGHNFEESAVVSEIVSNRFSVAIGSERCIKTIEGAAIKMLSLFIPGSTVAGKGRYDKDEKQEKESERESSVKFVPGHLPNCGTDTGSVLQNSFPTVFEEVNITLEMGQPDI